MAAPQQSESKVFVAPVIPHTEWDETEERVLIFSLTNGETDDEGTPVVVDYTMPNKPHVGMGLAFLRVVRRHGIELALSWLLEEALGEDAYDALTAEPDLAESDLKAITRKVQAVVLGGLEGPKGS